MLEVRYIIGTGEVTGWCGDKKQFGNLDRERDTEQVVILAGKVPSDPLRGIAGHTFDAQARKLKPKAAEDLPPVAPTLAEVVAAIDSRLKALEPAAEVK